MADTYVGIGTLTGLVRTAYSAAVEFAFQPKLYFAQFGQPKKWSITDRDPMPGNVVTFTIFSDLSTSTGELSETGDPTRTTMGRTQKSVTLKEYGQLVTRSRKIQLLSFANIDMAAARVVGDSMGRSVDFIARAAFDANSTYAKYASGSEAASMANTPGTRLTAADVRYAKNRLARENVIKADGQFYIAIVHPDCAHDLRAEVSAAGGTWRAPKEYVEPEDIYIGEVGEFEGFRFIETSQCQIRYDIGSQGATLGGDIYTNYFFGYQAIGYAEGVAPSMGISGRFLRALHVSNDVANRSLSQGNLRAAA